MTTFGCGLILLVFLASSMLEAANIALSNGITVNTASKQSLLIKSNQMKGFLSFKNNEVLAKKYSARYGFQTAKKAQFYVELNAGRTHDELSKIVGPAETIIDENLGIYSASLQNLKNINPEIMKWIGLVKPHHKIASVSLLDKKKPMNTVPRLYKNVGFKFNVLLTKSAQSSRSSNLKESLTKGFEAFSASKGFNNYIISLENHGSNSAFSLEVVPKDMNKAFAAEEITGVYDEVLKYFAERSEVLYIERAFEAKPLNIEAYKTLQSGLRNITGDQKAFLYRNGITGVDQIIQVTDTGVDSGNCMFHDKNNPVVSVNSINKNHRKVIGYYYFNGQGDTYDSAGGHGTHVAGTVAGSLNEGDSQTEKDYHGVAPDAKLVFFDINNEQTGSMTLPADLSLMFNFGYDAGARIFTNSWGFTNPFKCTYANSCTNSAGSTVSDSYCLAAVNRECQHAGNKYKSGDNIIDNYLYNKPEIIILFAVGNDGTTAELGTVSSPSLSKNVMGVGAADVSNAGLIKAFDYEDYSAQIAYLQTTIYSSIKSEADCCAYSGSNWENVRAYCCAAYTQAKIPGLAHVYNETNMATFSSRGPVYDDPQPFQSAVAKRIKPDVVAPGYRIVSAHSSGKSTHQYHCASGKPWGPNDATLLVMQGTSMATPAMAGGVGLIRQFFSQNLKKYSIGYSSKYLSAPSGPLLKALSVHAAQPMTGNVLQDGTTSTPKSLPQEYPNYYSGFGEPDLSYIIPLKNEQLAGNQPYFDIKFDNLNYFMKSNSTANYSFRLYNQLEKSGKFAQFFRVTLAYYDAPSNPNTVTTATILEGDIDLVVSIPSKSKTYYGNGVTTGDRVNTVEQIMITGSEFSGLNLTPNDEIIVTVKKGQSGRFNPDYVPYSIVVSSTYSMTPANTCFGKNATDPTVCNGRGICTDIDTCSCNNYNEYGGNECDVPNCFGYQPPSLKVCSGNGQCVAPNKCECTNGFSGEKCSISPQSGALRTSSFAAFFILVLAFLLM